MANRISRITDNKRESFQNVADYRVGVVLQGLQRLTTCADRARYESTPEEVAYIRATLQAALDATMRTLETGKRGTVSGFSVKAAPAPKAGK